MWTQIQQTMVFHELCPNRRPRLSLDEDASLQTRCQPHPRRMLRERAFTNHRGATWGNANGRQRTACYSASCTRAAPLAAVAASPREQRTALHAASASASASLQLTLQGEPRLRPRARARMPQMANKGSASGSRWKHCSSASCMPARLKAAQQVSRRECRCAPSAPSPLPARKARAPALSRQQFPSEAPRLLPGDQGSHFHQSLAVAGCE